MLQSVLAAPVPSLLILLSAQGNIRKFSEAGKLSHQRSEESWYVALIGAHPVGTLPLTLDDPCVFEAAVIKTSCSGMVSGTLLRSVPPHTLLSSSPPVHKGLKSPLL